MRQHNGTPAAPAAADSVAGALEEYLAAAEAGTAPPREQFLARYPELAEDLDACLAALRLIGRAAEGPRSVAAEVEGAQSPEQPLGQLGDFRLIREVGRGGMGVVYEAEQVSLGRRVALKVLPFAATLDPRQLQRFHNEARAAASLDHPHIVHVHAVGCERAVHFYAMQFIDGQTLGALIADLRRAGGRPARPEAQPTTPHIPGQPEPAADTAPRAAASTERGPRDRAYFRRVAELGIQAADALDHAHALGIVHRDVKPANLLVDGRGGLWVTDFGLAHIQSDSRLTMTGDLVGTLRYMSPEQALAQRVGIDHRTDVYSLGVTLYELLTLEPVFLGNDRQELLRQIAFEEPARPRRINKAIPAELETIVLKAMEKNPAERYATAKELAEDLRRWLEDRPIRAKRPSLRQRARKWMRRHRPLVGAVAAVLALAVLMLAGGVGWVARDRATLQTAVGEALNESSEWQGRGRLPEALSAARRAEGLVKGPSAGEALRRQVTDRLKDLRLLEMLEEARLEGVVRVDDRHFDDERVDALYAQAFRSAGVDVEGLPPAEAGALLRQTTVAVELAAMLDNWAMIRRRMPGRKAANWEHFLAVARAADPDEDRTRAREALEGRGRQQLLDVAASKEVFRLRPATLDTLGYALWDAGAAEQAVALLREAQRRFPDDFWINLNLAEFLQVGQPSQLEEAVPYYFAAVALRPNSGAIHAHLGYILSEKKDWDGAIAHLRKAIDIDPRFAFVHNNLGNALRAKGDLDGAMAEYHKAIDCDPKFSLAHANLGIALRDKGDLDGAMAEYHKAIDCDPKFAGAHYNLGNALYALKNLDGAIDEYRTAIELDPKYAAAHNNLGSALRDRKDVEGAIAAYRQAIALDPKNARAHNNLGSALRAKKNLGGAIAAFRQAIALDPRYANAHYNLGNALHALKNLDGAIDEYRLAIALDPKEAKAHNNLGGALYEKGDVEGAVAAYKKALALDANHVNAHNGLAAALHDKGDVDGAIDEVRQAIKLEEDFAKAHCNLGNFLCDRGQFAEALTHLRRGHELGLKAPGWSVPSAQWVKQCERLIELDRRLPAILSGKEQPASDRERAEYAGVCQKKHLYASASRLYREALTAQPGLTSVANGFRYEAACAAAQAGSGAGEEAGKPTDAERAGLRKQALDWLRADLDAWRGLLDKEPDKFRPAVAEKMPHWLRDPDFNGVRGPEALGKLPEAERQQWQKLWADVSVTLARAQQKGTSAEKKVAPAEAPKKG